jgi:23S rRNA-/tRNA-specific pseudouridylate synthase
LKTPSKNSTTLRFVVQKDQAHLRLDRFLAKELPGYSRSRIQQLIRAGFIRLNRATTRPRHLVRSGDEIELTEPPLEKIDYQPEPIPLDILFEDNDVIVINKPPGLSFIRAPVIANTLWSTHCSALRDTIWHRRKRTARHRSSPRQGNEWVSGRREK